MLKKEKGCQEKTCATQKLPRLHMTVEGCMWWARMDMSSDLGPALAICAHVPGYRTSKMPVGTKWISIVG